MKQLSLQIKSYESGLLQNGPSVVYAGFYHGESLARPEWPKAGVEFNPSPPAMGLGSHLSSPAGSGRSPGRPTFSYI